MINFMLARLNMLRTSSGIEMHARCPSFLSLPIQTFISVYIYVCIYIYAYICVISMSLFMIGDGVH